MASTIHRSMRFMFLYVGVYPFFFLDTAWLVLSSDARNKHKQPTTHDDVK